MYLGSCLERCPQFKSVHKRGSTVFAGSYSSMLHILLIERGSTVVCSVCRVDEGGREGGSGGGRGGKVEGASCDSGEEEKEMVIMEVGKPEWDCESILRYIHIYIQCYA